MHSHSVILIAILTYEMPPAYYKIRNDDNSVPCQQKFDVCKW